MTPEEIDSALESLVDDMTTEELLALPGMRAALHKHLADRVLELAEQRQTDEVYERAENRLADWADRQRE